MGDLVEFANQVKQKMAIANRPPYWSNEEADQYMTASTARREQFQQKASTIQDSIIKPRLDTIAAFFDNASMANEEPNSHSSCWFGYCDRFPVTAKLAFEVQHDIRFEKLAVTYEAWVMPVFIKLNERDKITMALESIREDDIEKWAEERLMDFLDAYLRIDRGRDDFEEEPVTDPVCGMRINRSSAVASESYLGYCYFFCSPGCQEKFNHDPTEYVEVKSM